MLRYRPFREISARLLRIDIRPSTSPVKRSRTKNLSSSSMPMHLRGQRSILLLLQDLDCPHSSLAVASAAGIACLAVHSTLEVVRIGYCRDCHTDHSLGEVHSSVRIDQAAGILSDHMASRDLLRIVVGLAAVTWDSLAAHPMVRCICCSLP